MTHCLWDLVHIIPHFVDLFFFPFDDIVIINFIEKIALKLRWIGCHFKLLQMQIKTLVWFRLTKCSIGFSVLFSDFTWNYLNFIYDELSLW